jgi:hypothetical protein
MNNSNRLSNFVEEIIQLVLLLALVLFFLLFQNFMLTIKADRLMLFFQYIFLCFILVVIKKMFGFNKNYIKIIIVLLIFDDFYRNFNSYFTREFLNEFHSGWRIQKNSNQGDILQGYGILSIIFCILFPNFFLIFSTNVKMGYFDLFILKNQGSVSVLYYLVFRYNGMNRNPYSVLAYSFIVFLDVAFSVKKFFQKVEREESIIEVIISFFLEDEQIDGAEGNISTENSINIISSIQNFFNLNQLNYNQLYHLRKEISSFLENINEQFEKKKEVSLKSMTKTTSEKCVICLENEPDIICSPCQHQCLCSDCLEEIHNNEKSYTQCFLCRMPIISWEQSTKKFQHQISPDEFKNEGHLYTMEELKKLTNKITL